jgi:hypothetical protein
MQSVRLLGEEGLVFNLPKGTLVILLPATVNGAQLPTSIVGTFDSVQVCTGTVESGKYIGTSIAIACESLLR